MSSLPHHAHPLRFHHPFAGRIVHRQFHECRGAGLPLPAALSIFDTVAQTRHHRIHLRFDEKELLAEEKMIASH